MNGSVGKASFLALFLCATPAAAEDLYVRRSGEIAIWLSNNLPRAISSLVADPDKAARTIIQRRRAAGDRWAGIIDFSARPSFQPGQ